MFIYSFLKEVQILAKILSHNYGKSLYPTNQVPKRGEEIVKNGAGKK